MIKTGSVINKWWQICVYANDIIIIARSEGAMKEAYCSIEIKGRTMGFKINEEKTKYMKLPAVEARCKVQKITIGEHRFEGVKNFVHPGSSLNNDNNMSEEIK